jgi:hypothetical protein
MRPIVELEGHPSQLIVAAHEIPRLRCRGSIEASPPWRRGAAQLCYSLRQFAVNSRLIAKGGQ